MAKNSQKNFEGTITSKFEEAVEKYPDLIAVKSKWGAFSYSKLNKRANKVARILRRSKGFNQKRPVAIILSRGIKNFEAIFGIWKSGSFLVFLNPSHPEERLAFFLKDSGARVVLTDTKNFEQAKRIAKRVKATVVNIDLIGEKTKEDNLNVKISPNDPAFIVYTSGTTGRPKGVVHIHRNMLVFSFNAGRIKYCPGDIFAFFYAFGHISSMTGICYYLFHGSTIYVFDLEKQDSRELAKIFREERISYFASTPSIFRAIVNSLGEREKLSSVKAVMFGGEVVYHRDFLLFKKHFSSKCLFINRLGTTAFSAFIEFCATPKTKLRSEVVPVGKPHLQGVEVFIEGKNGVGEIVVRSENIVSRYWNRPEENSGQLLPLANGQGTVEKTGDIGRFNNNGEMECLGRIDDSRIKINGNQVEIKEIEKALAGHRQIINSHLAVFKENESENFLVLFYMAKKELDLRSFFLRKFPLYMLPRSFVKVDIFPLTVNGKIDQKNLEKIYKDKKQIPTEFLKDQIEQRLAKIWKGVLRAGRIGRKSNFFELGGTSLKAMSLISLVERFFGAKISHADVYKNPELSSLAMIIKRRIKKNKDIYPSYFNCFYTSIPQILKKRFRKSPCLSLLPAFNFACLPSYVLMDNFMRRECDDNANLLGKPDFRSRIGLEYRIVNFKNRQTAISYYNKNQASGILIFGTPYYLPYIPIFYKKDGFIKAIQEKKMLAFYNISMFSGELEKGPLIFSGHLNFQGRINKEEFLKFWEGNRGVPGINRNFLPKQEIRFRVFEILNKKFNIPNKKVLHGILKDTAEEYFASKVIKSGKEKKIIFGKKALITFEKELDFLPDVVIVDMIFRFSRAYFFLRDALIDLCSSEKKLALALKKIKLVIGLWKELHEKCMTEIEEKDIKYEHIEALLPEINKENSNFLKKSVKKYIREKMREIGKIEEEVFQLLL